MEQTQYPARNLREKRHFVYNVPETVVVSFTGVLGILSCETKAPLPA